MNGAPTLPERVLMTLLVWGLLLELILLSYYHSTGQTAKFEYHYTLFLFIVTAASIGALVARIAKRYRRALALSRGSK